MDEHSGKRFLRFIECDHGDCDARIAPHPDIANSGWTKRGWRDTDGTLYENNYCPRHS